MNKKQNNNLLSVKTSVRWSAQPLLGAMRRKIKKFFQFPTQPLKKLASATWEIAPGSELTTLPGYFLENQLARVTGRAYAYHWDDDGTEESLEREMAGGITRYQTPTMAYLLHDVFMIDGAFYKADAADRVYPRSKWSIPCRVDTEISRGAVQCTIDGNLFFGLWLQDDCVLYPLAKNEGIPITTAQVPSSHMIVYEKMLDMQPLRVKSAFFRELVIFDDRLQNHSKKLRFNTLREKLFTFFPPNDHPGVFVIRGNSGKKRSLLNELEVAEYMKNRHGFRVVDVTRDDVPTILAACTGARMLMGVEGSHLVHGLTVLKPGAGILVLQPPFRFCPVIKRTTDRDGQHFGFVVGFPVADGFRVDVKEIEQTLALFPKECWA